jgi:arginyl-tRNA synthetase
LEPEFNERAHREVVALQAGDETNTALWQRMVDISARMFNDVYSRLGVDPRLKLQGESFYNSRIAATVKELEAREGVHVSKLG